MNTTLKPCKRTVSLICLKCQRRQRRRPLINATSAKFIAHDISVDWNMFLSNSVAQFVEDYLRSPVSRNVNRFCAANIKQLSILNYLVLT